MTGRRECVALEPGEWLVVESTNVLALRFDHREALLMADGETEVSVGDLFVAFHSGGVYRYSNSLLSTAETIANADSIGAAVNRLLVHAGIERVGDSGIDRLLRDSIDGRL